MTPVSMAAAAIAVSVAKRRWGQQDLDAIISGEKTVQELEAELEAKRNERKSS